MLGSGEIRMTYPNKTVANCRDLSELDVLIYAIRRTESWWSYCGSMLGFRKIWTVTDLRGEGDFCVVNDFNRELSKFYKEPIEPSSLVSSAELEDVIARCRLLRFLPYRRARAMILAMAKSFCNVLDQTSPAVIISFPIDRYVSDVLRLMAAKRGIPYYEMTAGPLPNTIMLLQRGALQAIKKNIEISIVDKFVENITRQYFKPSYLSRTSRKFTRMSYFRIFFYFKTRGYAFKAISWLKRDRFSLHYLDAQSFLGHKPKFSDHQVIDMVEHDWEGRLNECPKGRSVFLGLAVFPEAALDYWIDDLSLVAYEQLMVSITQELADSGFHVFVKDHPLQFGFRKTDLIRRLKSIRNVTFVPYEVSGKRMVTETDITVTCTGTIGLEAALIGKKAVIVDNYYNTDGDFIVIKRAGVRGLGQRIIDFPEPTSLLERQRRIVTHLLEGSTNGDFLAFEKYRAGKQCELTQELARNMSVQIYALLAGERGGAMA